MKRLLSIAALLLVANVGVAHAAPNFVDNNGSLPATKTDRIPITNPTQQWGASDANTVFNALADVRTVLKRDPQVVFNVMAFAGGAAINNGTVDATAAVAAAISAAGSTINTGPSAIHGGTVYFPKGVYKISSQLSLTDGVELHGDNPANTILRAAAGMSATSLIKNQAQDGTQEYAFISSLQIDCNTTNGATFSEACVSWGSLFINSYIRDVVILNSSSVGIHVFADGSPGGSGPVLFENLWVANNVGDNVFVEDKTTNNGAVAGFVFVNLTSEHQGSNKSAILLKGNSRGGQINFYNTHIEMGGSATHRTAITIDGWPDVNLNGVQLQTGNAANIDAGITITSDVKNVRIQIRSLTNINLINPVINDVKNSVTVGNTAVPIYSTPDVTLNGQRFLPNSAGLSAVFQNSSGTDKAWFNTNGALTGASVLGGAGIDIIADATNNRAWCTGNNAGARFFCLYYPDSSFIRFRALSAGFDSWDVDNSGNFRVLQIFKTFGKVVANGAGPSVSSCGTSPSVVANSTDFAGAFTTGTAATTCTVTFSSAFANAPTCVISGSGVIGPTYTTSTTAISVTVDVAATTYSYVCMGH